MSNIDWTHPQTWAWIGGFVASIKPLLDIHKYLRGKTDREIMGAIGTSFRDVVQDLSSENESKRYSAAILLRRFFSKQTEYQLSSEKLPYKDEALDVIAAHLKRIMKRSDELAEQKLGCERVYVEEELQKILADGLNCAIDVVGKDFQRADLHGSYLGRDKKPGLDISKTDFYRADFTRASLRNVTARGTVFKRACMKGAVFDGADLTECDFRDANLVGASFKGSILTGARFDGADLSNCNWDGAKNAPAVGLDSAPKQVSTKL